MKVPSVFAALFVLGLGICAQGILPELPYPGGYTFLRYEIRTPDAPPVGWILEVTPRDGRYEVRMTVVWEVPASEEFPLFEALMGAGMMGDGGEGLPLVPLFSLWDKEIEVGKSYLLRERARLITERGDVFLGIPVIVGTYLHPGYPDLRATVYIPELPRRALFPLPPYLRVEEKEDGDYRLVEEIELVEFRHEG